MVAGFIDKPISKSYVRLPGTGSNLEAEASFCDLSRGSNLAAFVPVPQSVDMPRNVYKRPRNEETTTESKKRCQVDSTNQNNVRPSIDQISKEITPQEINCNNTPTSNATGNEAVSKYVPPKEINTNNTPTTNTANNVAMKPNQNSSKIIIFSNTQHDVVKLKEENKQLKTENASLHKKVSLFKQLLRNPQRLESVLQRLNERTPMKPAPAA